MALSLKDLGKIDHTYTPLGGRYIMALDSGTTSVRAVIVDEYDCVVAQASRHIKTMYPRSGWVEQDPMEILASQIAVMMEVQFKSGIHSDRIAAIGITNQRETTVVWDRDSGQPIHNAIVWQCRRTADISDRLVAEGMGETIRRKTGLMPDPYFSGTKIRWILDNVDGARAAADAGELMFGTIDTWLIYNLTGGAVHATDYTNASRTMLFNIHTLEWDDELLKMLDIPRSMLPEVRWSSDDYGSVSNEIMTYGPPITGVAGDQQASLFGHCCFTPGCTKNTYGTGCFMLMNTGDEVVHSKNGLLSTIGIAENGKISYALEGSIFHAGSTIQWLRDKLGIIADAGETAAIARSLSSNNGCYLVPAFSGLGAPWWDPDSRGLICGLTAGSDRATLVRAACESMAYQTMMSCVPWRPMPAAGSPGFPLMAPPLATSSSCSSKRTCWESPSFSPRASKQLRWVPRTWRVLLLAIGKIGTSWFRIEILANVLSLRVIPLSLRGYYQVGMMLWRGPVPCYSETRVANRAPSRGAHVSDPGNQRGKERFHAYRHWLRPRRL